ncbi:MAG: Maf family nucleotide pyrophosphatase [Owenweeksia sp.]
MQIIPQGKKLVLASKSPRRQELLRQMGLEFSVRSQSIEETYPEELEGSAIAEYLAVRKAHALAGSLAQDEILLTSDTVVWCEGRSLEKAKDGVEAYRMLRKLSGKRHEVITAVCLQSSGNQEVFSDTVRVYFRQLTDEDIHYYISHFRPFDKAGAYGIQEWIGMTAITAIEGSFFTVMGLPTHLIYERLPLFGSR